MSYYVHKNPRNNWDKNAVNVVMVAAAVVASAAAAFAALVFAAAVAVSFELLKQILTTTH